jgi:excisionase family DNA binding protein
VAAVGLLEKSGVPLVAAVEDYLRVSKRNLYCWRMAGLIPHFKIGRAARFRKSEVDAALERMRMG